MASFAHSEIAVTIPSRLLITRDSVHAGDDCEAPHARWINPQEIETLEAALRLLLHNGYLPSIAGGCATWIVRGPQALAVIAQQWQEPRFLVNAQSTLVNLEELRFVYLCQVDPELVFDCLLTGAELPDKYSGFKTSK